MESYPLKPEQMRAPDHPSPSEIRKSLAELDSKIKILQGRANATAADSHHTYHQHIAALEAKKAKIMGMLGTEDDHSLDTWKEIRNGIEIIRKEVMSYFEKKPDDKSDPENKPNS